MAEQLVPPVEPGGVGAEKPAHTGHQVGSGRLQDEVKMVAHETEGVDLPVSLGAGFGEGLEETLAIQVVVENRFPSIPTIHHMVDRAGIFDAQLPRHGRWSITTEIRCKYRD